MGASVVPETSRMDRSKFFMPSRYYSLKDIRPSGHHTQDSTIDAAIRLASHQKLIRIPWTLRRKLKAHAQNKAKAAA